MANKTKKIAHLTDQWHVRDENGGIFGPVAFSALKGWVEDGRVSPSSEVSCGDGHWELAERVAELEMNCVAELESGSFYGPIHCKAMRGLIQSGAIPAEAIVYTKQSAEQAELVASLQEELHAQRAELVASQKESDKRVLAQQTEITTLNGAVAALQVQMETLGAERENYAAEIDTLARENQEQRVQFEQREQRQQAELQEKASTCTLQLNELTSERNRAAEDMMAKNLQLAGLLQRLEELEQANQGLKEEFANYANYQNNKGADDVAQRKLFLLKNILAEAALVLEGVEDCCEESAAEIQDADPTGLIEGELLEYEEVSVEELKPRKDAPSAVQESDTESNCPPAPERNTKAGNSKTKKKWPFGSAEKQLGHNALAELEAQAQIELQRLASSQKISALFDRKK